MPIQDSIKALHSEAYTAVGSHTTKEESSIHSIYDQLKKACKLMRRGVPNGAVLIVEDNESNAEITQMLVEEFDVPTKIAKNAKEALEYCCRVRPRLILMDIGLPDIDGLELTRRLKAYPHLKSVPIFAVTAHVSCSMVDEATESGCMIFIPKPFAPTEFKEIIQSFI